LAAVPIERPLIMARTQAGIQRAKERGVAFGRPTKLNAKQRRMIGELYAAGETAAALARQFEVGEATIWRALNRQQPDLRLLINPDCSHSLIDMSGCPSRAKSRLGGR
jgi:DNA invertase Pin-like site-specific DNA recombinase